MAARNSADPIQPAAVAAPSSSMLAADQVHQDTVAVSAGASRATGALPTQHGSPVMELAPQQPAVYLRRRRRAERLVETVLQQGADMAVPAPQEGAPVIVPQQGAPTAPHGHPLTRPAMQFAGASTTMAQPPLPAGPPSMTAMEHLQAAVDLMAKQPLPTPDHRHFGETSTNPLQGRDLEESNVERRMVAQHKLVLSLLDGLAHTRCDLALACGIQPPVRSMDTPALAAAVLSLPLPASLFTHGPTLPGPRTRSEIPARKAAYQFASEFYRSTARPEHPSQHRRTLQYE
ncbi:uncharacterized protein [Aegilops tauschii subsp. strangulata]|uniref:uncharacterized protein n=1 Tax=Aegilops tauschii subsp. strangulata TaxID=200361 RepID=UPI001E1CAEB7|nr:translation initiation factor IF-2-like [Aegilops tauschii subsp. strangulata]